MKPKKQFRPANLRSLLAVLLVIIAVGGGALFYYGLTIVRDYAVAVNERAVDAEASGKQIQELQLLKSQLSQSDSLVAKADQLFTTPESYQSQALNDVRKYAEAAGLAIANTSFTERVEGGAYTISVTFKSPSSYTKLITFLNNIESNLPKLQVSAVALSHAQGGADSVKIDDIKIDITVR